MVDQLEKPPSPPVVRVAVPSPLRTSFDYWAPTELGPLEPGVRVTVPFGRLTRVGMVLENDVTPTVASGQLKSVLDRIDYHPLVPKETVELIAWAARYYHHPVGEVVRTALPGGLGHGLSADLHSSRRVTHHWACTKAGREVPLSTLGRAVRQANLLAELQRATTPMPESKFSHIPSWRPNLSRLVERGWVHQVAPTPVQRKELPATALNASQQGAVDVVRAAAGSFEVHLLEGVTGSGKTEVYLTLIKEAVQGGGQALVLVPEIGLTPQMLSRFRATLPFEVGELHSNMNDGTRRHTWLQATAGEIAVVIGTRSAVFVPLARPALFIVDEEHDLSFKQQDGFRYSARDIAIYRAFQANTPVVLGSATPALESLRNAKDGRYRHLRLPERAAGQSMPVMRIIDIRRKPLDEGLSEPLLEAIDGRLSAGEQSLLFVNRRGFAPVVLCHDCGWVCDCKRCDSHMVVHSEVRSVRCHHCGAVRKTPVICESCKGNTLVAVGIGTERIARVLKRRFPHARVGRIVRDTMRIRGAMEAMLSKIHAHDLDIIVGTQMVVKGHHFPLVTLVGILDADGGLYGADFLASERMAQLIIKLPVELAGVRPQVKCSYRPITPRILYSKPCASVAFPPLLNRRWRSEQRPRCPRSHRWHYCGVRPLRESPCTNFSSKRAKQPVNGQTEALICEFGGRRPRPWNDEMADTAPNCSCRHASAKPSTECWTPGWKRYPNSDRGDESAGR